MAWMSTTPGLSHMAVGVLVVCLTHAPALARDQWGAVALPGGAAAARQVAALGSTDRPGVNLLIDLAHGVHTRRLSESGDPAAELLRYQAYLAELRAALDRLPAGLSVPAPEAGPADAAEALDRALALVGLRLAPGGSSPLVESLTDREASQRARWLAALDIDREAVAGRLSRGETVVITWADDALPLPLPDLWRELVFEGAPVSLAGFAARPDTLLLYTGLISLDRRTLAWLATRPDVFERLSRRQLVGPFAAFGRSVRVHDGAVVVPGDTRDIPLWESLVGARVTDPAQFVIRLFDRRDGRLAYFYDTAAQVGERSRAFMLGDHLVGSARPSDRLRFVRRVADEFAKFAPTWRTRERSLFRPAVDPALVVAVLDVNADGTAGPGWWTVVLDRVASGCSWTREARPARSRVPALDAVWVLRWVFAKTAAPDRRLAAIRLLQRRFSGQAETTMADVEVAVCARQHLPALALALDRMGVERPALYSELALVSRKLTGSGESELPALRAWQASLSIVEQSARHRGLPAEMVDRLLSSLARAVPERESDRAPAVATWILDELLPALGADLSGEERLETAAITTLVGPHGGPDRTFVWEGLSYRIDVAGVTARSVTAIRDESGKLRLEHVHLLLDTSRRLEKPSAGDIDTALASLRHVALTLESGPGSAEGDPIEPAVKSAVEALERAQSTRDLLRASRARSMVVEITGAATADVLTALAYALAMSPAAGPPEIYAEAHRFHDFGNGLADTSFGDQAWAVPREVARPDGGSRVSGALLGLDLARAPDQLRRVAADGLVDGPVITESDYQSAAARLVLAARATDWPRDGARVAQDIARGRQIVADWIASHAAPEVIEDALARAAVSGWRTNFAAWLVEARDRGGLDGFLTMTDFYRLGTGDDLPDGWGQSGWLVESCWCLRKPDRRIPEFWQGRSASLAASTSADLPLRLTELLATLELPHDLLEPLMPMALQDAIDHASQISTTDWEAFAWPRHLKADRIEAYLLELVASHTLAPPRGSSAGNRFPGGR